MEADDDNFELGMDIVEDPLSRTRVIPMEKGTMLELFTWSSKNLSPEESEKVKEVLVEHNETIFHDPEKILTRTDTIKHKILTLDPPERIPRRRVPPEQRQIMEDEILKMEKEGNIRKSSGPWCSPIILVRKKDSSIRF